MSSLHAAASQPDNMLGSLIASLTGSRQHTTTSVTFADGRVLMLGALLGLLVGGLLKLENRGINKTNHEMKLRRHMLFSMRCTQCGHNCKSSIQCTAYVSQTSNVLKSNNLAA